MPKPPVDPFEERSEPSWNYYRIGLPYLCQTDEHLCHVPFMDIKVDASLLKPLEVLSLDRFLKLFEYILQEQFGRVDYDGTTKTERSREEFMALIAEASEEEEVEKQYGEFPVE